jgi:hypothetical protein
MLQNTFCHMPGIGPKTERRLWAAGVLSWQDAAESGPACLAPHKAELVAREARESLRRLQAQDARHFAARMPASEAWRLFPEFRHSAAYLDIETTGLCPPADYITTIALYDGRTVRWYVQGDNLKQFRDDIRDYRLLVTYNGKTFDLPFIRESLRLPMDQAHIDLRYVLHGLGLKGGLKGCERQLGLDRGELDGVDGYFAVLLWREYVRNRNLRALETLLAYNITDVVNLETLMVLAYNMKVKDTAFADTHRLPAPRSPKVPFKPHVPTIESIRRRLFGW